MLTRDIQSSVAWTLLFVSGFLFFVSKYRDSNMEFKLKWQKHMAYGVSSTQAGEQLCPVSSETKRYSQGNEDIALFEHVWSNPVKCYGTFVELGALDGVRYSNTKYFEDYLGWNGVLIEASPSNYGKLKANRKKTFNYHTAICKDGVKYVEFVGHSAVGGIVGELPVKHIKHFKINTNNVMKIPCEPIGPLLRKLNITKIDLFSLDVEGSELMVLETMDWTIPVHVFVVEKSNNDKWEYVHRIITEHGYQQAEWDIRKYCTKDCPNNVVYVNSNYV